VLRDVKRDERRYPALSSYELTIYYEAEFGSGGTLELWQVTRAMIGDAFGAAQHVSGINSDSSDQDASITANDLELFFASNVTGVPHLVSTCVRL
jgi:hypothetical protein